MLPRQSAKQDGDLVALGGGKRPFIGALKRLQLNQTGLAPEPRTFGLKSLCNLPFRLCNCLSVHLIQHVLSKFRGGSRRLRKS